MVNVFIKCFFGSIVVNLLAGCGAIYKTTYDYKSPNSQNGIACITQCKKTKSACEKMCHSDEASCEFRAHRQAQFEFKEYVLRQKVKGQAITRDLNSFYNSLQCQKNACDCAKDYHACFQLCGGRLIPKKKCVAFCGDA